MTMTDPAFTDSPGVRTDNAILILAREIGRLADSLDHLAVASQALRVPASTGSAPPVAAGPPAAPRAGEKTLQQKRGGLIYYTCNDHNVTAQAAAESAGRGQLDADSRKWADADQIAVLDAMKDWGWIENKR